MTCKCSHVRFAHSHYRKGTDCSECDCQRLSNKFDYFMLTVILLLASASIIYIFTVGGF